MKDPRNRDLARLLVGYSTKVQPGEAVMIHGVGAETAHLLECIQSAVLAAGGYPVVRLDLACFSRRLALEGSDAAFQALGELALEEIKRFQAYIAVRGTDNVFEMADVPAERLQVLQAAGKAALDYRVNHTKWVVLRFPNASMAQLAQTSTEAFADFYYRVCTLDYAKMDRAMDALKARMERSDEVRIVTPTTELRFSIKGIPAVKCSGEMNIPDGECFTAPVRDSVNGHIEYNTPTVRDGVAFDNIRLVFRGGKVVEAEAGRQTARLNQMLDVDEGARYLGEFSFGFNPHILHPMRDILFDEKISGSIHMALGRCYEEAPNGNDSTLHWDLIQIHRPEYGGGEIYLDGELVRKDGVFVTPDLVALNPEQLA